MRSNYSRGGKRGNFNNGGQGRGGYQGDRPRDGDRPQTSGGGYYNKNRGGDYKDFNNGSSNRFSGGDMDSSRFSESTGRGGRFGGGGRGRGGKQWDQGRPNTRDGGAKFHSGPTKSLQSFCNPDEGAVQTVKFHTNQYKMTIGKNAPQFFQYSVTIENWCN